MREPGAEGFARAEDPVAEHPVARGAWPDEPWQGPVFESEVATSDEGIRPGIRCGATTFVGEWDGGSVRCRCPARRGDHRFRRGGDPV